MRFFGRNFPSRARWAVSALRRPPFSPFRLATERTARSPIAAAVPGIIDWLSIKDAEVKRIADWHARLNIIALIVFALSLYLRMRVGAHWVNYHLRIPFVISFLGMILISISGWLGGELAYKHGVGVAPQHDSPEEEAAKVRLP